MDVFGPGADLLLGEAVKGVGHKLEVLIEMAWAGLAHKAGQEVWVTECSDESGHRGHPPRLDSKELLATDHALAQVPEGVSNEGAGDASLDVALGAIGEGRASGADGAGCVSEVIGHHLVGVDATIGHESSDGLVDDLLSEGDRRSGLSEIRCEVLCHGVEI